MRGSSSVLPYSRFLKKKYKTVQHSSASKRRQLHLMSFFIVVVFVGIMMTIIAVDVIFVTWDKQHRTELLYSSDYVMEEQPQWTMVPDVSGKLHTTKQPFVNSNEIKSKNKITTARTEPPPDLYRGVDHWQRVRGYSHKFFVFSAYYDDREGEVVRVIAATITKFRDLVRCKLFYEGSNSSSTSVVEAKCQSIKENWHLKYSAFFVLCNIEHGRIPNQVSVIPPGGRDTNRLRVHIHEDSVNHEDRTHDFAICVKPMHYNFNNYNNFVEFVEFNRLLGVDHFIFYNHSIGPAVDCIMKQYIHEGVATVLPWQLDIVSQKEIRTEGQFAAWNDCMYRVMNRYKYAIMIDMDETIIPHQHDNLADMLDAINKLSVLASTLEKPGAFSFMNNFFYQTWPDDPVYRNSTLPLITLRKTRRKQAFTRHKIRSKCIVMPLHVTEMGNHFVWTFQPGWDAFSVPYFIGFSHHYRHVCEFGGTSCLKADSVIDNRTHHWSGELLHRFKYTLNKNEECIIH